MSDISERIAWVLKDRGWSESELARRAKLKSRSHIGLLKTVQSPKLTTVLAIAKAAGVNFAWLATGAGEPTDHEEETDVYPNRGRAIRAARILGFEEQDIAIVLETHGFSAEEEPPIDWWFGRIKTAHDRRVGLLPAREGAWLNPDPKLLPPAPRRGRSGR